MRTVLLSMLSIVALAGAPLAAADEAPSAAFTLCSAMPNPLLVQFSALSECWATAQCAPFANVECRATGSSTSCSSADRDCSAGSSGERGFVTCNGSTNTTKYCGGPCCGSDGVCEASCPQCADPDCLCPCIEDGTCNAECGCSKDPDCCTCDLCSSITNCTSDLQCSQDCPGSICTSSGICLCAG